MGYTSIHLIRHGFTIGLKKGYFYGWLDFPVIEEGLADIDNYKSLDIYPKVDLSKAKFYTTGLTRTIQTMKRIYGDVTYEVVPDLREINFGSWEGHDYYDLEKRKEWNDWMTDFSGEFTFPHGDSVVSFYKRVHKGIEEVISKHEDVSLVFCHGGTISAIMEKYFKGEKELFSEWTPKAARGYTLILNDKKEVISYEPI